MLIFVWCKSHTAGCTIDNASIANNYSFDTPVHDVDNKQKLDFIVIALGLQMFIKLGWSHTYQVQHLTLRLLLCRQVKSVVLVWNNIVRAASGVALICGDRIAHVNIVHVAPTWKWTPSVVCPALRNVQLQSGILKTCLQSIAAVTACMIAPCSGAPIVSQQGCQSPAKLAKLPHFMHAAGCRQPACNQQHSGCQQ